MPNVLWFRRDLRTGNNVALAAAAAEGPVVPLFVLDPRLLPRSGAPRRRFLADCLQALDAELGGALVVRTGDPAVVVPHVAGEVGARWVFHAADFGPYGRRRDEAVARALVPDGRVAVVAGSPYAVAPGTVRKPDGSPYAVFSPFRRAWESAGWDLPGAPVDVSWDGRGTLSSEPLPEAPTVEAQLPLGGPAAGWDRLDTWMRGGIDHYDEQRNLPGVDGTSRLSPYLRWGCLHPTDVLDRLGTGRAHDVFRSELCWREFYADVLFHHPDSAWHSLQRRMDAMPADTDAAAQARFEQWGQGRTGYPIVDAGMRQLLGRGWVHNRVRMIVASFLVKDLHLPWQWGARYFMDHLVDGDLASNNHGWQWVAGTGTDAAPYFRVFNPVMQGEKFDPDGEYVRRWVPELAHVATKDLHAPWRSKRGLPLGYPPPMVDHAVEREEALRRYALVTTRH